MAEPKPKAKGITLKLGPAVKVERIEAPPPAPQELVIDNTAIVQQPFTGDAPKARTLFGMKPAAAPPKPAPVRPKPAVVAKPAPVVAPPKLAAVPAVAIAPETELPAVEEPEKEAVKAPAAAGDKLLPKKKYVLKPKSAMPAGLLPNIGVASAPAPVPVPAAAAAAASVALGDISPELQGLQELVLEEESKNPYKDPEAAQPFVPENSKDFIRFVNEYYSEFKLPKLPDEINPNACSQMGTIQTYKYQQFIREYMRQASPYRGVLVYHGLGSGKTCTSIATLEALYGQGKRKIIILTPTSLQENFLNELSACGFHHFRLKNKWESFSIQDAAMRLFAQNVLGIPKSHLEQLMIKPMSQRVVWMPDLAAPESDYNYDSLQPWQKTAILEQIRAYLKAKFTFIGYTGWTRKAIMNILITNPTMFDNAVIVIDEVHNLTRLMAKKLDKYLNKPVEKEKEGAKIAAAAKITKYEPVTTDPHWIPKVRDNPKHYDRAYLIYRLLTQAKNSKIIALSGTPIVNHPLEVGILGNILHGYFNTVSILLSGADSKLSQIEQIVKTHPRIQFYDLKAVTGGVRLFFSIMEEGYMKEYQDDGTYLGVEYQEEFESLKLPKTIQELHADIVGKLAGLGIASKSETFEALPLFPPTEDTFTDHFIDKKNLGLKNSLVFIKRMSGLISYYKGSKKELMPEVISDEIVECPFSSYALGVYSEARNKEIKEEKKPKNPFDEAMDLGEGATSYRFRSRAACNFVFPEAIKRPFPTKKKDFALDIGEAGEVYGDGDINDIKQEDVDEERAAKEQEVEDYVQTFIELSEEAEEELSAEDIEDLRQEKRAELGLTDVVKPKATAVKSYAQRLQEALAELRKNADHYLIAFDESVPEEEQLATYSHKFKAIYDRIIESPGSSLVYSNFKTVEGIDTLALALEVNDFAPISLAGSDDNPVLSEETIESFTTRPEQPRYIVYSGSQSLRQRQTLINIFNMRLDKLPKAISDHLVQFEEELDEATGLPKRNLRGDVCKVFMITGAGAEGLSLKNVRTVHITEPYWNKVRTDQVKGRAIRICSHSELPYDPDPEKNERTVEIFTYISVFDKQMLSNQVVDKTLVMQDKSRTTDEYIQDLANRKEKVSSAFLLAMKQGAIDCQLNYSENEKFKCYAIAGPISDFLYDPRLLEDISKTNVEQRIKPPAAAAATAAPAAPVVRKGTEIRGKKYGIKDNGLYAWENSTYSEKLGEIVKDPATGKMGVKWLSEKR